MPIQRAKPRFSEVKNVSNITADQLNIGQIGGRRNIIINGAMQVAQRATSATSITTTGYHTVDRFKPNINTMGTYTISQSTTAPTDFTTSLKIDCTTADASPASGDSLTIQHRIEGQNLQHLNFGSSSSQPITLSFHVRSNKTGTFVVSAYLADTGKQWGKTYTINSANTWEKKTIIWESSTNSATINDDSGDGLILTWYLGVGSGRTSGSAQTDWTTYATADEAVGQTVNIADSTSNEFYLTGVQLEVGSVATPFEHRSYGDELYLCQRYFEVSGTGSDNPAGYHFKNMFVGISQLDAYVQGQQFKVEKRADATVTLFSRAGTSGKVSAFDTGSDVANSHAPNVTGSIGFHAVQRNTGTYTVGKGYEYGYTADAEL